jgi:hypothetical protein
MQINKISLSDLFSQLIASFRLVGDNPWRFALASLLFFLVISALMFLIGGLAFASIGQERILSFFTSVAAQNTKAMFYFYAFFFIYYLALVPVLGGWLKFCQKLDIGTNAASSEIFTIYKSVPELKKLILYFVVSVLLYLAVTSLLELLLLAFGIDISSLATKSGGNPSQILNMGIGFWIAILGMACIGFLTQGMLYLGFIDTALSENSIVDSLKAGIRGVLKSLLSIIVFTIIMGIILALCILMSALAGVALTLLHKGFAEVVWVVFFLVLLLFAMPLSNAWQYYFWKDILGKDNTIETRISDSEVSA